MSRPETIEKRYVGKLTKKALSFMKGLLQMDPTKRLQVPSLCTLNVKPFTRQSSFLPVNHLPCNPSISFLASGSFPPIFFLASISVKKALSFMKGLLQMDPTKRLQVPRTLDPERRLTG